MSAQEIGVLDEPVGLGVLEGRTEAWLAYPADVGGVSRHVRRTAALATKRVIDIVCSLLLLVILLPLLTCVAVLVTATSPGPAFYRQERIGRGGRPFHILKFRSMSTDADEQLTHLLTAQGRSEAPLFKVDEDPRVTRVGAFIRRSSIDELPQLINVLQGTMSLVGPRPQRAAEVAMYTAAERERLTGTPGMTGLWQVSGRSRLAWEEAVRLDVHYCRNWSLLMDLKILVCTVPAVLRGDGAQ